jgi:two-component system, NarL family, nitrate/nitrite response regulator NarL
MNNTLPNPVNIIIADDHQMIIDGLKSMIGNNAGYTVAAESNNGRKALDAISQNPERFQLLLTDISMPEMGGIELCREVKKRFSHIKVLVLSMYDNAAIIKECIAAEADGFVLKNAGRDELFDAMHRVSNNSTYYSNELFPIVLGQFDRERTNRENMRILTHREQEVLKLIVQELTSEEIAQKLFISKKTVDHHRANILEKTGCKSIIGVVKFALDNQI